MGNYKEIVRLKEVQASVNEIFPHFGPNKKREIIRLLYEISKKENQDAKEILKQVSSIDYKAFKKILLKRRYPISYNEKNWRFYLPDIQLKKEDIVKILPTNHYYPRRIFIGKNVGNASLVKSFVENFPEAELIEVDNFRDYMKGLYNDKIKSYNRRTENAFLVKEQFDYIKECPCSKGTVNCGYNIFNISFGCIYECSYCYLQEYSNIGGIIFSTNIEEFLYNLTKNVNGTIKIGSGEFTDSLMLDNITNYSTYIIEYLRKYPNIIFEFKTKSANISKLMEVSPSSNIVIAWSLNPEKIIKENEFYCASLEERINAAVSCVEKGYRVAFHFDPIFYYEGWQNDYASVLELVFNKIQPKDVAWISLGTFRFKKELKKIIERRFPSNKILDEELILDFDNKLRYPPRIRIEIYRFMVREIQKYSRKLYVYLCMENKSIWKEAGVGRG